MREQRTRLYNKFHESAMDYIGSKSEMENIIFDIARKVDSFRNHKLNHCYYDFSFDEETVRCKWHDTWGYGGEDSDYTEFPISLFYGDESVDEYVNNLNREEDKEKERKKKAEISHLKSQLKKLTK